MILDIGRYRVVQFYSDDIFKGTMFYFYRSNKIYLQIGYLEVSFILLRIHVWVFGHANSFCYLYYRN